MASKSSRDAHLESLAKQEEIQIRFDTEFAASQAESSKPLLTIPAIALIGVFVIGGSIAGGYLLARQQASSANSAAKGNPSVGTQDEPLGRVLEDARGPDAQSELAIEPAFVPPEVDIELAKVTGFDVLVKPSGAKVSLDGQFIGAAPLRVRNLLPGLHAIDIEGPKGFFGKHLEFDLAAGKSEVLNLELDSLDGAEPAKVPVGNTEPADPIASAIDAGVSNRDGQRRSRRTKKSERRFTASDEEVKLLKNAQEVDLGTLMLMAKPPCEVSINGKPSGVTPLRAKQLTQGLHQVVLTNEEHNLRKSFKVKIKSGLTTRVIQDLRDQL